MTVTGYTDSTGSPGGNLILSQHRADAVAAWLVSHGVEPGRIGASGRGETDPVGNNDTAEGRQQNRRVVITVAP